MVKAKLRTAARQLGIRRPKAEQLQRRARAMQAKLLKLIGRDDFVAPRAVATFGANEGFLWRGALIDGVAHAAAQQDVRSDQAIAHVVAQAEIALAGPCYSVVDKLWTPPGGDKHDYFSGPSYWWPTPDAPHGIPWTFRDGHMNPVRFGDEYDLTRLDRLAEAVKMLTLGWRYSARSEFATKAAALICGWFLDPATAMRPHLAFAQIVPGQRRATGTGIIETLRFITIIDSIELLADSGAFASDEIDALRDWFGTYLRWMRTSENGRLEQATNNNHGLSYDIQVMAYALFARDEPQARAMAASLARQRIHAQVRGDGSLPEEVRREESFFYVAYGVGFLFDLATVAERAGVDLWHYRSSDGSGIETAMRALIPYALNAKPWPHGGKRVPAPEIYAIALRGARIYSDDSLAEIARQYAKVLPLQPIDLVEPPIAR